MSISSVSPSAFSSGLSTLQGAQKRIDQASAELAKNTLQAPNQAASKTPNGRELQAPQASNQAESLVNLRVAENEAKAGARVIKTADEALGTLIDTRA